MRLLMLSMCGLFVAGVFVTAVVIIWNTRDSAGIPENRHRQTIAMEFAWTAIPCLMILAAAIPAVFAIVSAHDQ